MLQSRLSLIYTPFYFCSNFCLFCWSSCNVSAFAWFICVCFPNICRVEATCNWIKLPKTFSAKTRTTTWKGMIYISRKLEMTKKKEKNRKEQRWRWDWKSSVHIFGCINFPSEWRTFDGCVNCKPTKCTTTHPIQVLPLHRCHDI